MPIGPYDRPAESQAYDTFVDTYVPIPFDEMMQVGLMKQKQYEQTYDALSKTYEDVYNLKYIPNSKDEQYIRNVVIPTTSELFDKYANQDLSDPVVKRQMRMDFNTKIDRNRIRGIQDSYEGWKQNELWRQKLAAEDRLDPYEEDNSLGYDTATQGIYNKISTAYSDPIIDLQKKYFAPLKDTLLKDAKGRLKVTPRGYNLEGVTEDIVNNVTEKNLDTEIASNTGRRAIKMYRERYGITKDQASDKDILRQVFTEAGEPFIRENLAGSPYQEWMFKDRSPKETPGMFSNISNTQSLKNTDRASINKEQLGFDIEDAIDPIKLMKSGVIDEQGNLKPKDTNVFNLTNVWQGMKEAVTADKVSDVDSILKQKANQEYEVNKGFINKIRKNVEGSQYMSDSEIVNMYAKAYKNAENVDYNVYLYNNIPGKADVKKQVSDQVIDDLGGRTLISAQTGKEAGKVINKLDDVFEELDVPKEDRKKSNISIVGAVPAKNAYKATIFASDGPHDFLISTNQREQYLFNLVEKANKLANTGVIGEKELIENQGTKYQRRYIVRTRLQPDPQKGAIFVSDIVSGDGKPIIPGTKLGLDEALPLNMLEYQSVLNLVNP